MPDLKGGTPRDSMLVAEIGGERYLVAQESQASQVGGGARSWATERIALQESLPEGREFAIPIGDFSQGAGYTFADRPGVYDWADGWDCTAPNKPGTWPRLAVGQSFTTADYRGWILPLSTYVYIMRGRYCCKYAIDDTPGSTWNIIEIHDFGSGNVVTGRPAEFLGKMYVPLRAGSGGALAVFHELTTVVSSVTETQTIVMSGTPTGGTYTVTFDGKTTAAIAYNASAATLQAALRLIAGLELVTVSSTGSTPNFTHTVVMTGVGGSLAAASPPQMTSSTASLTGGAPVLTHATTVAGTADTWTAGPGGKEMSAFIVNKNLLFGANSNTILSCATVPTTSGNWSATSEVGQSGQAITDFFNFDRFLGVNKTNGPWTFDDTQQTVQELPDLGRVIDSNNGFGSEYSNGHVLIPHKSGLIRWRPQNYEFVGPEQEGAQEQARSVHGFGRIASLAPYGKQIFFCMGEDGDTKGAIGSFVPPTGAEGGRGPLIPHIHHVNERAYEALAVVTSSTQPAAPQIPATWSDDNAVGTITWADTGNAAADDASSATAAAGTSHYLKGLAPPVNVPSAATIIGVKADIVRRAKTAPTVRSQSQAYGSSTSATGTKPTGTTDDDILIAFVATNADVTYTAPAGWTLIARVTYSATYTLATYRKIAASEGASWTWTLGASGAWRVGVVACSGGLTASVVNVSATDNYLGNLTTAIAPTVTTTSPHALILAAFAGNASTSGATCTPPTDMTELVDVGTGATLLMAVASVSQAAPGATGTKTFNVDQSINSIASQTIALTGPQVVDNVVKLVRGGSVVGNNLASASYWPASDALASYGGNSELWGTTLTAAQVNAADFGIVLSATTTTGATAAVDYIALTVYYSVAGQADPSSFLIALKIDTTRTVVTPEIYKLPRNNMPVVNDAQINRNGDDCKLYTSRYWQPSRNVQKTWRDFEFFLDCGSAPSAIQVPFQVWAVIDDALPGQVGPVQLLNAAGAAADIVVGSGSSRQQVFFPPGTAVGSFVQLQFIVPAASGQQVTGRYDIRDGILRGVLDPLTADQLNITLVLGDGEFEDRTSMRRTVKKQIADLKALTGRNTSPVAYKDINGNTGYLKIESLKVREIQFKEFQVPVSVAQIIARELPYA